MSALRRCSSVLARRVYAVPSSWSCRTMSTMNFGSGSGSGLKDPVALIVADHNKVKSLAKQFESTNDMQLKQKLGQQIITELSLHAGKEELALYPLMRTKLGDSVADRALNEHAQLKVTLKQLEKLELSDPQYLKTFRLAMQETDSHVAEEESEMLPNLMSSLNANEKDKLYDSLLKAEKMAPTHPHPMAPDRGILGAAAMMSAKPLDKMKDMAQSLESETLDDIGPGTTSLPKEETLKKDMPWSP